MRQRCPLSALLYVLVIEVLAIQLRINPNIVGFKVGGEKIVSAHYVDDATIIIKQNRCFKEVIKELNDYEEASGAKINYDKTKGLWTGGWKNRRFEPMNIKWTSKNVENLGIFFGNDNPALATYEKIIPNLTKRLNYWKQFHLTQIGKARIVETFLASKLIYATRFYPIPTNIQTSMQKAIFDYVTYPMKTHTIAQTEMWKTKENGGIKLINIAIKSGTAKAKWLIEMKSNDKLRLNLLIFEQLMGQQKAGIFGRDLIFLEKSYFKRHLETKSEFYREALMSLGNLELWKGIQTINDWDKEHIFFNPMFTTENGKSLNLVKYCKENDIYRYEQLVEEKRKELAPLPFDKKLTALLDKILVSTQVRKEDILVTMEREEIKFKEITQKLLYEETLLQINSKDHHSAGKWIFKLTAYVNWHEVWNTVHNILSTNQTKTLIWQQIHLNFYTQYSYNKWHRKQERCPLCLDVPRDIFHIILHCKFIKTLWTKMEPRLLDLHPVPVSEEEMVFGIVLKKQTTGSLLRNWITFLLRELTMQEERVAYHASTKPNIQKITKKINISFNFEIHMKAAQYKNENKLEFFDKIITYKEILCKKTENEEYEIRNIFV